MHSNKKQTTIFLNILTVLLISIYSSSFSQTGLYKCNEFKFKSESNPASDRSETDTKILTLSFDGIENNYFIWRMRDPDNKNGDDVFFKWNIKSKVDATFNKEENYVQTIYSAKLELLGEEVSELQYLYKIDDVTDKSLTVIIYSPQFKTRHYFYNLTKF